jgi:hypothetical protein
VALAVDRRNDKGKLQWMLQRLREIHGTVRTLESKEEGVLHVEDKTPSGWTMSMECWFVRPVAQ